MPSRNPSYRWQVLAVVTLTQTLGLGMTWNYVLMVAPDLEAEFGLESWGALWSGGPQADVLQVLVSVEWRDKRRERSVVFQILKV